MLSKKKKSGDVIRKKKEAHEISPLEDLLKSKKEVDFIRI
jgi:hypothetical protein